MFSTKKFESCVIFDWPALNNVTQLQFLMSQRQRETEFVIHFECEKRVGERVHWCGRTKGAARSDKETEQTERLANLFVGLSLGNRPNLQFSDSPAADRTNSMQRRPKFE